MTLSSSTGATALVGRTNVNVFLALCCAQTIALLGSEVTAFGLAMSFYQRTGSVAVNGLIVTSAMMPQVLAAPLVGVLVDRWDRRATLLVGHAGGALCASIMMLVLGSTFATSVGAVSTIVGLHSCAHAAELTVVSASTASLVRDADRGRANGVVQLTFAIPQVLAPIAAGVVLPVLGLRGLVGLELASAVTAFVILLAVRVPTPSSGGGAPPRDRGAFSGDQLLFGWRFLRERPGLMRLGLLVATINFNLGFITALVTPLVLGLTASTRSLGLVLSVCGAGMIAGGICMAAWGGPRGRVRAIVGVAIAQSITLVVAASCRSGASVACVGFAGMFLMPIMAGCSESVWQRKVASEVQGRVFSFRLFLNGGAFVAALLVAGLLVDRVFEPAMRSGGPLARLLGPWTGTGGGRGSAAALVITAALSLALVGALSLSPRLRLLERELPNWN